MRFRFHSVTRFTLLALLLMPTASLAATPISILWDDSHDGPELNNDELSGHYSDFADLVETEGHSITELDGTPGSITALVLGDYDVLMFFDTELAFTPDEVTVIQAWVAGGGLLFVAGETVTGTAFDEASQNFLLAPYGVSFVSPDFNLDLGVFAVDPLTDGLTAVDFLSSSTVAVAGTGTKVLGSTSDNRIGFAYGADGAVVVVSDSDAFTNNLLESGDNEERLVKNLLAHFAGPDELPPPTLPTELTIDVKPETGNNPVNPKSKGVVEVAILTTSVETGDAADFDPWESVDPTTIVLGPGNAAPSSEPSALDVDSDGDLDMSLTFQTEELGVQCGLTELELTAMTFAGDSLVGSDSITTPGCK